MRLPCSVCTSFGLATLEEHAIPSLVRRALSPPCSRGNPNEPERLGLA